jgi:translation initiation factor 1
VIKQEKILTVDKHELVIKKEKRKGKTVTLIGEFFHSAEVKKKLSGDLKKKLSTGGSICDTWLELQGDVAEAAKALLVTKGYPFKR